MLMKKQFKQTETKMKLDRCQIHTVYHGTVTRTTCTCIHVNTNRINSVSIVAIKFLKIQVS